MRTNQGRVHGARASSKRSPELQRLLRELRRHLPEFRERYGLRSLGAFGSYVRGGQGRRSDLDLLAEFDRPPTLLQFVRLQRELGESLGVKVDLVMKSALKPGIGARILDEVVPV